MYPINSWKFPVPQALNFINDPLQIKHRNDSRKFMLLPRNCQPLNVTMASISHESSHPIAISPEKMYCLSLNES